MGQTELRIDGVLRSSPYAAHRPQALDRPLHTSGHFFPQAPCPSL